MLTVGDLFSGISGFSLGLERAGMRTRWFAEVDPFASAILRKHWPGVPNHGDVRFIRGDSVERVDVLCGGFPCQDISNAGKGAGIDGERSGLWAEYARIIGEIRPRYVIVENVAALLGRGMGRVLGDLAALGYDAEWHVIPAAAVGAPHLRERVWIIATDADGERRIRERLAQHADEQGASRHQPDGLGARRRREGEGWRSEGEERREATANTRCEWAQVPATWGESAVEMPQGDGANRLFAVDLARLLGRDDAGAYWRDGPTESPIRGVDDGVPAGLHRHQRNGLNAYEVGSAETFTTGFANVGGTDVPEMRNGLGLATPSSELCGSGPLRDSLPVVPREGGSKGRAPTNDSAEGLQSLRSDVRPKSQQKAHDVQPRLPVDDREVERRKALARERKQDRGRLACLGNAVVPQIVEIIGRAIVEREMRRAA